MSKSGGAKSQHKTLATTGKVPGVGAVDDGRKARFGEGGFVRTDSTAQLRGAREGFAHRTGKKSRG